MTNGMKSSEFWVTTIAGIAAWANQSGLLGSVVLPAEALATIAGIIASYVISRGLAK